MLASGHQPPPPKKGPGDPEFEIQKLEITKQTAK